MTTPTELLVATDHGLYLLGSSTRELAGHDVHGVAVDGDTWWAAVDSGVWQRPPTGEWTAYDSIAPDSPTCLTSAGPDLWVGTTGAHVWRRRASGHLERLAGFESSEARADGQAPWGSPDDVRSIAVARDATFVNLHILGLLRSPDGTDAWESVLGVGSDVHQVLVHGGTVYAATGTRGLAISEDSGKTWAYETVSERANYLRAVAVAGDTLLVSSARSSRGEDAAAYRRPIDGSAPFQRCTNGLPPFFFGNIDTHCLHATGSTVVLGTADGEVYESEDEGATWRFRYGHLPLIHQVMAVS